MFCFLHTCAHVDLFLRVFAHFFVEVKQTVAKETLLSSMAELALNGQFCICCSSLNFVSLFFFNSGIVQSDHRILFYFE